MVEAEGLIAIGAGIAMLGGALGTAIAQKEVLPAAVGAVAENPKNFGKAILFAALPETILFISFVLAILIMSGALGGA